MSRGLGSPQPGSDWRGLHVPNTAAQQGSRPGQAEDASHTIELGLDVGRLTTSVVCGFGPRPMIISAPA